MSGTIDYDQHLAVVSALERERDAALAAAREDGERLRGALEKIVEVHSRMQGGGSARLGLLAALRNLLAAAPPPPAAGAADTDALPCMWCGCPGREHLGDHSDCPDGKGHRYARVVSAPPAAPRGDEP